VLTADYDFWLHIDDIAAFNPAIEHQDIRLLEALRHEDGS
jgi:hypothetical protein